MENEKGVSPLFLFRLGMNGGFESIIQERYSSVKKKLDNPLNMIFELI